VISRARSSWVWEDRRERMRGFTEVSEKGQEATRHEAVVKEDVMSVFLQWALDKSLYDGGFEAFLGGGGGKIPQRRMR
jgi:hypothetical protein